MIKIVYICKYIFPGPPNEGSTHQLNNCLEGWLFKQSQKIFSHPVQFSLEQHLLLCPHNMITSKIHLCVRIPTLFQETFLKKNHSTNHDSNISLSWQEISCLTGLCRQSHKYPAKEPENWKHHQLICESYNCSAWRKKGQNSSRVIVSSRNRSEERVEWHCACWP